MSDRPLNILTVTSIYPTPEEPGLGAFVASQVASLRKAGLGVDVLFLDARRSKWELVRGIAQVRTRAASGDYDLVHAHFGYNGVPACLQSRLPVVISFCGTDLNHPRFRPISRWVARRADACIVKSDRLREILGIPAAVIPNGVDTSRFRPIHRDEARRRLGLIPDARYALFVSNPARPEKRYDLAKAAVAAAQEASGPIEMLVLHNRPQHELPVYFNAADLLLLTSSSEGSPNAVKEAMACNLPIVSTDVGDVRQVLGKTHNCAVCDPVADSLAHGIRTVLCDGARSNGRSRIAHLASDAVAARIVAVYRRALDRGGRP
jgi:glycosyltransferase involved in cell wall biosynthesis